MNTLISNFFQHGTVIYKCESFEAELTEGDLNKILSNTHPKFQITLKDDKVGGFSGPEYCCSKCGVMGVKLWRHPYKDNSPELLCLNDLNKKGKDALDMAEDGSILRCGVPDFKIRGGWVPALPYIMHSRVYWTMFPTHTSEGIRLFEEWQKLPNRKP